MGDSLKASESTAEMLKGFAQYIGPALKAVNEQVTGTARAQLEADKAVSPGYAGLQQDIFSKYAPAMAALGREIEEGNQLAASQRELDITRGPGAELTREAVNLQRAIDPEYFASREAIGQAITNLLAAQDPSRLTENEREEIARGLSRQGFANPRSAIDAASNAAMFGKGLREKQTQFGDAITKAASALPGLKTGFTGFEVATQRALTPSPGGATAPGVTTGAGGQNTFGFGGNLLNNMSTLYNTELAKSKDFWDKLGIAGGFAGNMASMAGRIAGGVAGGVSDRNLKENILPVDEDIILDRVKTLDISSWNYKGDNVPHIGPMAQDVFELFGFGDSDTVINFIDANGILLAAVKALAKRVAMLEAELYKGTINAL